MIISNVVSHQEGNYKITGKSHIVKKTIVNVKV